MRILIAYFSRTGSTESLAAALADKLKSRGHTIEFEVIKPVVYYSLLREVSRDFPRYPSILFSLGEGNSEARILLPDRLEISGWPA